jgi:hypothetical protein
MSGDEGIPAAHRTVADPSTMSADGRERLSLFAAVGSTLPYTNGATKY